MPPISGRMSLPAGLLCGLLLTLQMAQVAHAAPSPALPATAQTAPRGDTCDESKCRSPGLTNLYGQGYSYDCWANEYGPLSPWNSPYEAYACADDYAGHWIRNGTENYQYYTCCKNGKNGSTPTQEGNELFDASWHSTRHVCNMNRGNHSARCPVLYIDPPPLHFESQVSDHRLLTAPKHAMKFRTPP